ncbi:DUF4307 domain-containing protein [Agromyces seonyuensis]|uniref:DUF4307 domain-containing protein n=1 Tax=Agromyces seonyuensis TaxID=2662446 RepID=A0A6I4P2L7_9MICO|nr:DUF4307 domain-containing protein [Agromyces seonyuensis]
MADRRSASAAGDDAAAEDAELDRTDVPAASVAPAVNPAHLEHLEGTAVGDRYGRKPGVRRKERGWLIGGAVFLVVVLAAWLGWAGLGGSDDGPALEAKDLSHTLLPDERAVEVTWSLSVPAGTATECAVQALDEDFTVVGWKVVPIPAGDRDIRAFTETVRTARTAVTGVVAGCWVA